jgi:heat shock protein HtpX
MNDDEVEAVIAHELGHILNRDILISSIAATIAAAITFAARMLMFSGHSNSDDDEGVNPIGAFALMLLAPLAAFLVQMAISRTREYGADAAAARYTGSTQGMISALTKLEHWSRRIPMDANPAMSHMYIFPVGAADWVGRLFSTHPSTAERVQSLRALRMTN